MCFLKCLDLFGPIRTSSDAFGPAWKRLDNFETRSGLWGKIRNFRFRIMTTNHDFPANFDSTYGDFRAPRYRMGVLLAKRLLLVGVSLRISKSPCSAVPRLGRPDAEGENSRCPKSVKISLFSEIKI